MKKEVTVCDGCGAETSQEQTDDNAGETPKGWYSATLQGSRPDTGRSEPRFRERKKAYVEACSKACLAKAIPLAIEKI